MKKKSRFFTDSEGRTRYMGNDRKAKDTGGAQVAKTETAPQRGEKGQFITKDGKRIFINGPGGGGGSGDGAAITDSQTSYINQLYSQVEKDLDPKNKLGARNIFYTTSEFTVNSRDEMRELRAKLPQLYTEFSSFVLNKFNRSVNDRQDASSLIDNMKNRDYRKLTFEFFGIAPE